MIQGHIGYPIKNFFLNGSLKILDSPLINVKNVSVDTLKQPLFDIKPIEQVKNYFDTIKWILDMPILIGLFITGIIYLAL